jgi:HEPN domain-containing protein
MERYFMRPLEDPEVRAWLEKADRDFVMAQTALGPDFRFWDQVCFHSQQAAEKALKALLVAFNIPPLHTHDLVRIAHQLTPACPVPDTFEEICSRLSQYSVNPRYPSFLAPETEDQARRAIDEAKVVLAFVQEQLR